MSEPTVADTRRLNSKPQDLTDAYGPPSNFLEIDVYDPQTIGVGRSRFTTYEVRMRTNLPIFKLKESCVRRRYSDFEWLKNELERDSKIVVPTLPGKALKRQLPFRGDEGIFEESFIEERRAGLEQFINRIAGHPLAQNERCLHMFLQEEGIDRNYIPGKQKLGGLALIMARPKCQGCSAVEGKRPGDAGGGMYPLQGCLALGCVPAPLGSLAPVSCVVFRLVWLNDRQRSLLQPFLYNMFVYS
ncbi:hypothetical protein ANANG_G00068960 [Anguilla anguilla]|uniref:PX domain-containing protein n=1 Tax=Anguilla anguilla TaxID=7936 RepID=A0A9D3S5V6_ANGAN|nr:hypothetical protein ANANG_G00068960 [Anguilla anguilla]